MLVMYTIIHFDRKKTLGLEFQCFQNSAKIVSQNANFIMIFDGKKYLPTYLLPDDLVNFVPRKIYIQRILH